MVRTVLIFLPLVAYARKSFLSRQELDQRLKDEIRHLETSFNGALSREKEVSSYQTPKKLESVYFHVGNIGVNILDTEMSVAKESKQVKTNLKSRIMEVTMFPESVLLEGTFYLDRTAIADRSSYASGKFSLRINGLECKGPAAILLTVKRKVEWISLQCSHKNCSMGISDFLTSHRHAEDYTKYAFEKLGYDLVEEMKPVIINNFEEEISKRISQQMESQPIPSRILRNTNYLSRLEEDKSDSNDLVDGILQSVAEVFRTNLNDSIDIPDIEEGFHRRILLINIGGGFKATEGIAAGLSTIKRDGDSRVGPDPNTGLLSFIGNLKLGNLKLMYSNYKIELFGIGPRGTLSANVKPLTVFIKLSLNQSNMKITLDDYRVNNAGVIHVKVTGLGRRLSRLVSAISDWVTALFKNEIIQMIESRYSKQIKDLVSSYSLYDLIGTD